MKFYWTIGFILSTIMLSLPASASWRCPALYGAYFPTVARCPNWVWDQYGPAEQAAEQAADNARRRAEAARAAQAQEEAAQAESARLQAETTRLESQRKTALAIAQRNAETSPDNVCREPQTARKLLDTFNGFDWLLHAFDIEHLATVRAGDETISCHGNFMMKGGQQLEGTITFKLNVAGDPIATWERGGWQPPIPPPSRPTTIPASLSPPSSHAFHDGVADRQAWEVWVNWLNGDEKAGALYEVDPDRGTAGAAC
jgi:hypothetical protein